MSRRIRVAVVHAWPQRAAVKCYEVAEDSRIELVLALAAGDPAFDGVDIAAAAIGVFGRPATRDQMLRDGDRVEIYRPLAQDPKAARRNRARVARQ